MNENDLLQCRESDVRLSGKIAIVQTVTEADRPKKTAYRPLRLRVLVPNPAHSLRTLRLGQGIHMLPRISPKGYAMSSTPPTHCGFWPNDRKNLRRDDSYSLFLRHALDSDFVACFLFCQCGSDRIELGQWNGARVRIKCGTCGREAWCFCQRNLAPQRCRNLAPLAVDGRSS